MFNKNPQKPKRFRFGGNLCRSWDYHIVHQQGSHIILETETPYHQRISIPNHNPLRVGTLNGILRAIARHKEVAKQDILDTLN